LFLSENLLVVHTLRIKLGFGHSEADSIQKKNECFLLSGAHGDKYMILVDFVGSETSPPAASNMSEAATGNISIPVGGEPCDYKKRVKLGLVL
jgi:hypothetical protein